MNPQDPRYVINDPSPLKRGEYVMIATEDGTLSPAYLLKANEREVVVTIHGGKFTFPRHRAWRDRRIHGGSMILNTPANRAVYAKYYPDFEWPYND